MKRYILSLLALILCITSQAQSTKTNSDKSIVTNRQYREFTYWVRDSIVNYLFSHGYSTKKPLRQYHNKYELTSDPAYQQCLAYFALPVKERLNAGDAALNEKRIFYTYKLDNQIKNIAIYPDTLCWTRSSGSLKDADTIMTYQGTIYDALTAVYFSSKWFDDCPVVGINQEQADAYLHWKNREKTGSKKIAQLTDATEKISIEKINAPYWQISAADYKVFSQWVADSILLQRLSVHLMDFVILDDTYGNALEHSILDWSKRKGLYKKDFGDDPTIKKELTDYFKMDNTVWNVGKMTYQFYYCNLKLAAKTDNRYDYTSRKYLGKTVTSNKDSVPVKSRVDFMFSQSTPIFPGFDAPSAKQTTDSAFWVNLTTFTPDISLLTYQQAIAYWHWFTAVRYKKNKKVNPLSPYMRPSKAEWEAMQNKGVFPNVIAKVAVPTKIVSIQKME